jgi:hypothetical protein
MDVIRLSRSTLGDRPLIREMTYFEGDRRRGMEGVEGIFKKEGQTKSVLTVVTLVPLMTLMTVVVLWVPRDPHSASLQGVL